MSFVRGLQRVKAALNLRGSIGFRSLTSNGAYHKDDMVVKMENPYRESPKVCVLCKIPVDFKNVQLLSQFVSPHTGRIYGRHITGLCGVKQKQITKAIKKARSMGFMPVTNKHPQLMNDPQICDIKTVA
ncbi:small ribosomal subunit protein bS18m [Austrofundulus limnaeus]|uniref:Small ribosomal subunit protein bS18m n=1 Tax=Austrofundulus limnaeus TaxID=52670 RepID=A0A2I4ARY8_AUSLI|nr:PREDICTED: 28S ribosomal protein S18c, mitochondrial [Austrofundulus limnaeus]